MAVKGDSQYGLYTGLESENYQSAVMAKALNILGAVSHKDVELERIIVRLRGEGSIILDQQYLKQLRSIVLSEKLIADLSKKNGLVAYSLGDRVFMCVSGIDFLDKYLKTVHIAKRESEIC